MDSQEFKALLVAKCAIDPKKPVLLGFSGGPDSVCLLSLLMENEIEVIAAHLDHSLRPGSTAEARIVKEVCDRLGIRVIVQRVDVSEFARQRHLSVEEAARLARYNFLFEQAERAGAQAVLTGHHADDQVETILMHLLRGSALSGLAGMRQVLLPNPWSETIPLVRPLLNYKRQEIESYLSGVNIKTLLDESNLDTSYYRNRIRHELIPLLTTYNAQIKESILRMAEVFALEDDLIASEAQKAWNEVIVERGEGYLVIHRKKAGSLHPALLNRLTRKAIGWMESTLRDINHSVIIKGSQFISEPGGRSRVDLLAGIEMFNYLKHYVVMAKVNDPLYAFWPQLTSKDNFLLQIPGMNEINDTWTVRSSYADTYQKNPDPFTCQIDADLLSETLVVSRFKPGDRFTPFGAEVHDIKLGDFWTNQGLPVRARRAWPIIRCGEEIVWVPGFRIADRFKVGEGTRKIIKLVLKKE